MELFGFEFVRKKKGDIAPSFVPKDQEDGAVVVSATGAYGTYIDLEGTVRTEAELVSKYRDMSLHPEIDSAVDEIVNEAIAIDEEDIISIILDNLKVSEKIKKLIREEFLNITNLLNFQQDAYDIFRRWYIDGRLYYHILIDEKNTSDGIKEIRYIDPRKIRKVREVNRKKISNEGGGEAVMLPRTQNEYFVFSDRGFNYNNKIVNPSMAGLRIAKDSIVHINSGLTDINGTMVLSYLHKGIKALNQLRTLEDALVIYRLSRAPERRIWYIEVGNLPKIKAEQYVRDIMIKHKNRLTYDASTGEVKDDRKFMTMLEDYWLPRREGSKGTEVTTLPGGQNLGSMDDVLYFQKKLYSTLNVPINRLNSDALFSMGRATEVTRDEVKFSKFIHRLRSKFATLFIDILGKQLILKQIISYEDWENISADIRFDFAKDNYFTELKDADIIANRVELATNMIQNQLVGKFYSNLWLRKNILKQTDDQIEEQDKQIEEEQTDPRWNMELMEPTGDEQGNPENQIPQANPVKDASGGGDNNKDKITEAMKTVDRLSKLSHRGIQDEHAFRSAIQIVARNKGNNDE